MAASLGTKDPDVALEKVGGLLFSEPYSFDFFQAVRLLGLLQPHRSPVGRYVYPKHEVVRFGAHPSLSFPASAVQALEENPDGPPELIVNFLGLMGPLGILPNYITELISSRAQSGDHSLLAFLNIFNHRLASLFYRAWEKHHFTVAYERDRRDPVTHLLFALIGMGTPGLRGRQPVEDESFLFYAGLLGMIPKSATALESVLSDYFHVPVEVEPFIGVWRSVERQDQCVFGSDARQSTELGMGALVGDEFWDRQSRLRIKLGPLAGPRYEEFLPGGIACQKLRAITKAFCGNDLEFEIRLILKREDVPSFALDRSAEEGLRLGWHTWLNSDGNFRRDPEDTILLLK